MSPSGRSGRSLSPAGISTLRLCAAAAAATALDGYPLACKGEGGRAIGLTTTASAIGTAVSMLFVVSISPIISHFALQFTSFEFFLLAFFGILISGTLTAPDLVINGWIAGFLGLFLACVGRDQLQFYPRFTFGVSELDSGIEVVPVLIGAFGIPQILQVLRDRFTIGEAQKLQRIVPELGTIVRNISDAALSYRVADWRYRDADGAEHPIKTKSEWLEEWHGMGVRFSGSSSPGPLGNPTSSP